MPQINLRKDENLDKALRKFKSKMIKEGLVGEMRKREFYEKPSQRKRKQLENAKRKESQRKKDEW